MRLGHRRMCGRPSRSRDAPEQAHPGSLAFPESIVALVSVACLALAACTEGGGGGTVVAPSQVIVDGEAFDMTGTWNMTVNPADPPRVAFDCTGDLAGDSFSFCASFEVGVTQDDVFFLPGPDADENELFCDSFFTMTGTATVSEITGVIGRKRSGGLSPPGELQELEFRAGIIGDNGTFALVRLTITGKQGECTLGGSYLGTRSGSP